MAAVIQSARKIRAGLWMGGVYLAIAIAVCPLTALTTKPGNVGYDWIPFLLLAFPWSADPGGAIPGVLINAGILTALGAITQTIVRAMRKAKRER